jgi:hypothetical protein
MIPNHLLKKFSPPALSGARDEQGPQLSNLKIINMWRLEILGMDTCSKELPHRTHEINILRRN